MLIIALVLAVIGLAALVAAVVTSNELIAWVCIGASAIGVLLLIADALRSRRGGDASAEADADADAEVVDADVADANDDGVQDYPEEPANDPSAPADAEPTDAEPADGVPTDADPADGVSADAEPADGVSADAEPEPDVAGVTDTEGESEPGGAVEISPDPEKTPEKN